MATSSSDSLYFLQKLQPQDALSLFSLEGKVALVTGGSAGLGFSAACSFLQAGASLVIICSRSEARCKEACEALNTVPRKAAGARAVYFVADVAKSEDLERMLVQVQEITGHIDILFANAGRIFGGTMQDHTDSIFAEVMDQNVRAIHSLMRTFEPLLERAAQRGHGQWSKIINASLCADVVYGFDKMQALAYGPSKAAAVHLGRYWVGRLASSKITVNSICLGLFDTGPNGYSSPYREYWEQFCSVNPCGRLGSMDDFAGAIIFLARQAHTSMERAFPLTVA